MCQSASQLPPLPPVADHRHRRKQYSVILKKQKQNSTSAKKKKKKILLMLMNYKDQKLKFIKEQFKFWYKMVEKETEKSSNFLISYLV